MAKVLNAVFGIGIAVVLFVLVLLGIQAFYPEPRYEVFCNQSEIYGDPLLSFQKCPDNITVGECRGSINSYDKQSQRCQQDFMDADKSYGKTFFIIASIFGVIILIAAFFLINMISISAGVACSGIALIFWAFIRGWQGTDDKLKFAVAAVVTIVVVTLAVIINRKLAKEKKGGRKR